ncbi:hypothetical protein FS749_008690 [Ceratobasidium sp. UAMH 11750]|nr:hypothetical protein FS749_008690 [Ceratobasidium sp. UAMH 11750]
MLITRGQPDTALNHPWLVDLARLHEAIPPPSEQRTDTPTEATGSVAPTSSSTSFVSSDSSTRELRKLGRFNDSMMLDVDSPAGAMSILGSALMVSGTVSVVSSVTGTTHTSDASDLHLVNKFSATGP